MGFTPTEQIWFNGQLVPWHSATVHVLAHGLQYGTGVFEGMRSYGTSDGPAVFRLDRHLERFFQSGAMYDLAIPYSREVLTEATLDVIRVNRLEASYIRPIAFFDAGTLSVWTTDSPISVAIAAFPTGAYLAGAENGVRVTVSPVRKYPSNAIPAAAKACGQYINSARAVQDAQRRGFDEAILLNQHGDVSEGSGENLFIVKNGSRFFLFNEKGDLIIAKLSPRGYEEISRAHLLEPTNTAAGRDVVWSHPAFANRRMYARNDKEIICVDLALK